MKFKIVEKTWEQKKKYLKLIILFPNYFLKFKIASKKSYRISKGYCRNWKQLRTLAAGTKKPTAGASIKDHPFYKNIILYDINLNF